MGHSYEARAAAVRFPFSSASNTMDPPGNQRIACTGAAQTYTLPEKGKQYFVYFRAIGVEVQVSSATSAQSLTLDQASSAAASTASAAAGMTLYAGEFFDRLLCDGQTHLCWISRSATGYVEFYISEAKFR